MLRLAGRHIRRPAVSDWPDGLGGPAAPGTERFGLPMGRRPLVPPERHGCGMQVRLAPARLLAAAVILSSADSEEPGRGIAPARLLNALG
jgi:hypothetical protein